jgi:hypothetical protein
VFRGLPTGCSDVFGICVYTVRKAVRRPKQDHINRDLEEIERKQRKLGHSRKVIELEESKGNGLLPKRYMYARHYSRSPHHRGSP